MWQHDPSFLWLKREDWPSLADAFARLLSFGGDKQNVEVEDHVEVDENKHSVDIAVVNAASSVDPMESLRNGYKITTEHFHAVPLAELYRSLVEGIITNNKTLV